MSRVYKQDTSLEKQVMDTKKKLEYKEEENKRKTYEVEKEISENNINMKKNLYIRRVELYKERKLEFLIIFIITLLVSIIIANEMNNSFTFFISFNILLLLIGIEILISLDPLIKKIKNEHYHKNTLFHKEKQNLKYKFSHDLYDIKDNLSILEKGFVGESNVSNILEQELSQKYILLNDIVIPTSNGKTTQIDHILIGLGKIFAIETKNIKGNFYPKGNKWVWYPYHSKGYISEENLINSPQQQSIYHAKELQLFLMKKGFNINILPVVVLTNPDSHWNGNNKKTNCPVFMLKQLVQYIVEKDNITSISEDLKEELSMILISFSEKLISKHYNNYLK